MATPAPTPPRHDSVSSSPKRTLSKDATSPPREAFSPPKRIASPPSVVFPKVISPPVKEKRAEDVIAPRSMRETRDVPFRAEKLSLVATEAEIPDECADLPPPEPEMKDDGREESNGVGDKIKIFEKAAEDAATAGRASRPGSMRRPRTERLSSDETPPEPEKPREPQRIVRPEFRPLASPAEVTIRSPSLGAKAPERFPSHGTAFRNVAPAPEAPRARDSPEDEEERACKRRDRPAATRGAGYFTRGSEEIWLVKKKDIEEIEERVLDSFRRAGGRGAPRGRKGYARSESLEATRGASEWAGRAHTLKRQSSVACTCGHDKKPARARHADTTPRPRSRSHGDPADQAVLDKYETLV